MTLDAIDSAALSPMEILLLAAQKREVNARWKLGMAIINGMSAHEQAVFRHLWLAALEEWRMAQESYWMENGL